MHGFSVVAALFGSPLLSLACVLLLSGLFGWAGAVKLRHPYIAAAAAVNLRVVSRPRKSFGRLLGTVELITAVALLPPSSRHLASLSAATLSLGFFGVVAAALWRGDRFACGCFGDPHEYIGWHTLFRSGFMGAAALEVLLTKASYPGLEQVAQAAVLASLAIGLPTLIAALRNISTARTELDRALNWERILQHSYRDIERPTQLVQSVSGGEV